MVDIDPRVKEMPEDAVKLLAAIPKMSDVGLEMLDGLSDEEVASSLLRLQDDGLIELSTDGEQVYVTLPTPRGFASRRERRHKKRRGSGR